MKIKTKKNCHGCGGLVTACAEVDTPAWGAGYLGDAPPPAKPGWEHTEQCLVFYKAAGDGSSTSGFGIAYYHYNPPCSTPGWIDFRNASRQPERWWPLPKVGE